MCINGIKTCEMEAIAQPRYHQIAHADYEKALRRAFWSAITGSISQQPSYLQAFNAIWQGGSTHLDRGIHEVEIDAITGSSGRYRDFNAWFVPVRKENDDRWVNVAQAYYEGIILPPVNLYKLDDQYYVADGNHRVSVARILGQETITASVIEIC